jgi:hypothetical protein
VWVHKLDEADRRTDACSGFVASKDRVLTAFQCVDGAARLELVFANGRKVATDALAGWDRMADWALIDVTTAEAPLGFGDPESVKVGERPIVFNVEGDPAPSQGAIGGPRLDSRGLVVGFVGESTAPGGRFGERAVAVSLSLYSKLGDRSTAVPISVVHGASMNGPATCSGVAGEGHLHTAGFAAAGPGLRRHDRRIIQGRERTDAADREQGGHRGCSRRWCTTSAIN